MRYDSSTYTDLTDDELIQLVQDGDEEAFAQLAARHSSRIWQLVVLNSRQIRDAEEIFQDIWVAVWENIRGLREVSSFGVGDAGGNVVKRLIASGFKGVEFYAC